MPTPPCCLWGESTPLGFHDPPPAFHYSRFSELCRPQTPQPALGLPWLCSALVPSGSLLCALPGRPRWPFRTLVSVLSTFLTFPASAAAWGAWPLSLSSSHHPVAVTHGWGPPLRRVPRWPAPPFTPVGAVRRGHLGAEGRKGGCKDGEQGWVGSCFVSAS